MNTARIPRAMISAAIQSLPTPDRLLPRQVRQFEVSGIGHIRMGFVARKPARRGFPDYWAIDGAELVGAAAPLARR